MGPGRIDAWPYPPDRPAVADIGPMPTLTLIFNLQGSSTEASSWHDWTRSREAPHICSSFLAVHSLNLGGPNWNQQVACAALNESAQQIPNLDAD